MSRQVWGDGSLFQRSDGRWVATYVDKGRRKQAYGKTAKEASAKRKAAMRRIDSGLPGRESRATFASVTERWKEVTSHTLNLSDKSRRVYVDVLDKHVVPVIGHVRIEAVEPSHVEEVMLVMAKADMSAAYRHQAHKAMNHVMKSAVRNGLVRTNPVKEVTAPRGNKKERVIPDRDVVRRMISEAPDERCRTFVVLTAMTGLRISEVLALRWKDVNFTTESITVWRGKGDKSRLVMLPESLAKQLRIWRKEQAKLRLAADWWSEEGDWIISTDIGTQMDPHNWRKKHFTPLRDSVAPGVTPHGLRHAYATIMLEEGVPTKVVADQLGHTSTRTTEDIYAHVTPRLRDAAREAVERGLGG